MYVSYQQHVVELRRLDPCKWQYFECLLNDSSSKFSTKTYSHPPPKREHRKPPACGTGLKCSLGETKYLFWSLAPIISYLRNTRRKLRCSSDHNSSRFTYWGHCVQLSMGLLFDRRTKSWSIICNWLHACQVHNFVKLHFHRAIVQRGPALIRYRFLICVVYLSILPVPCGSRVEMCGWIRRSRRVLPIT